MIIGDKFKMGERAEWPELHQQERQVQVGQGYKAFVLGGYKVFVLIGDAKRRLKLGKTGFKQGYSPKPQYIYSKTSNGLRITQLGATLQ